MPNAEACILMTAVPSTEVAEKIAMTVLEARLAACVQVVQGITSYYWWEGKVQLP
jgi:periplasmic divalent cation tolerance protein